jgi:hypothetical protein
VLTSRLIQAAAIAELETNNWLKFQISKVKSTPKCRLNVPPPPPQEVGALRPPFLYPGGLGPAPNCNYPRASGDEWKVSPFFPPRLPAPIFTHPFYPPRLPAPMFTLPLYPRLPGPMFTLGKIFSSSKGGEQRPSSSTCQAGPGKKKRKVKGAEQAVSQPKPAAVSQTSQPVQGIKKSSSEGNLKLKESLSRLERKAQLYEAARDRFRRSLVYHNSRFCLNVKEEDLVKEAKENPVDVDLAIKEKRKRKNLGRLERRKAKAEHLQSSGTGPGQPTTPSVANTFNSNAGSLVEPHFRSEQSPVMKVSAPTLPRTNADDIRNATSSLTELVKWTTHSNERTQELKAAEVSGLVGISPARAGTLQGPQAKETETTRKETKAEKRKRKRKAAKAVPKP